MGEGTTPVTVAAQLLGVQGSGQMRLPSTPPGRGSSPPHRQSGGWPSEGASAVGAAWGSPLLLRAPFWSGLLPTRLKAPEAPQTLALGHLAPAQPLFCLAAPLFPRASAE